MDNVLNFIMGIICIIMTAVMVIFDVAMFYEEVESLSLYLFTILSAICFLVCAVANFKLVRFHS